MKVHAQNFQVKNSPVGMNPFGSGSKNPQQKFKLNMNEISNLTSNLNKYGNNTTASTFYISGLPGNNSSSLNGGIVSKLFYSLEAGEQSLERNFFSGYSGKKGHESKIPSLKNKIYQTAIGS